MALTKPFAENGNKLAIPETTADGSVSYDQGFGAFYALPPEEGGLFIDRAQFNQLMYDTTSEVLANKGNIDAINQTIEEMKQQAEQLEAINPAIRLWNANPASNDKKIFTVGTSGADFDNLQDAINEAIRYQNSIKNANVDWTASNGFVSHQVIVMLVTDIDLPARCNIGATCGTIFIDLNKKNVYCETDGFDVSALSSAFIYNGTITKRSYQSPYAGTAIRSYGSCLVGSAVSFTNGEIDYTAEADGYLAIKGFSVGCHNGHWGRMSIYANISDCINCVWHYNTMFTNIISSTCSTNQITDGASAMPIIARGSGMLLVNNTTITSNIPVGGTVRSCINIVNGATVTIINTTTINNQGIATKCNIASNTPSENGIVYTNLF
jgi:hypothetical protein